MVVTARPMKCSRFLNAWLCDCARRSQNSFRSAVGCSVWPGCWPLMIRAAIAASSRPSASIAAFPLSPFPASQSLRLRVRSSCARRAIDCESMDMGDGRNRAAATAQREPGARDRGILEIPAGNPILEDEADRRVLREALEDREPLALVLDPRLQPQGAILPPARN